MQMLKIEQWPDFGCEGIKVQRAHQPTSQCQGKYQKLDPVCVKRDSCGIKGNNRALLRIILGARRMKTGSMETNNQLFYQDTLHDCLQVSIEEFVVFFTSNFFCLKKWVCVCNICQYNIELNLATWNVQILKSTMNVKLRME
eukprot:TRINITY_DN907_c0_g1_i3.p2 TRINITY_DN907_c0_g1~~TRINITY_DN907_c0_g1_i3.p2  ORF type:complete len:142 (-),score=13.70 TRINITY_DN907_c0_g1_i3:298-723(-)